MARSTEKQVSEMAIMTARIEEDRIPFPIQPPTLAPGVVPPGAMAPVMAMDNACYNYGATLDPLLRGYLVGFPGYPYLAQLATIAEYRAFASAYSTEITREWITVTSSDTTPESKSKQKVELLTKRIEDIGLKEVIQAAAEHESLFGSGQIAIDVRGHNQELPLILSPKTVLKGTFVRVKAVEPTWTTPMAYNAIDPMAPDFYRPPVWFMLGKKIHASRLLRVITRPMPDILKPAYNFGGMAMSQQAQPYVDNWRQVRQGITNMIDKYSVTALATDMAQILQGSDNGHSLRNRLKLFAAYRSNMGVMAINKETEELMKLETPLSTLDALQTQAQEHMCSVSRMPAVVLLGIEPTGMNASSEGTMRAWYDWIAANQKSFWRYPIDVILKLLQLDMFGCIDSEISFIFNPLYQLSDKEKADKRKTDADAAAVYIDRGVISPMEERERIAHDPESGYQGLDINMEIEVPGEEDDDSFGSDDDEADEEEEKKKLAEDAAFSEGDHPRDEDGKFTSEGIASKLGYKVVRHDNEDSFREAYSKGRSVTPGGGLPQGFANTDKEIHIGHGLTDYAAKHVLNHEIGHGVDFAQRGVDIRDRSTIGRHKHKEELKRLSTFIATKFKHSSKEVAKHYQNSTSETMAEVFAMYMEQPALLKMGAPKVYADLDNFLKTL